MIWKVLVFYLFLFSLAGEDKLKSGGDLPEESELLLESLPLNSNDGSDSNGTECMTIDSSITAT
jgi:hypothetical protein